MLVAKAKIAAILAICRDRTHAKVSKPQVRGPWRTMHQVNKGDRGLRANGNP